ncbi:MAG: tRNA lysidine(34) synthetase TilS [Bacteroidales bacterium]|nr:tRNA lysidine(34) synthetase TilS [Bacteroidales bacterium]MDD3960246.1 tRNA lysidine(34) synthetase TilS [Bacteroidales bacterium]MDY0285792.1 tRNA lysidine(34) synthetase TilS [Bacteroidales bacterium]
MQKQFESYLATCGINPETDRVLLTVSGGRDSMCMCDLFLQSGICHSIAHCNFHLRGGESNLDAQFVKAYAEQNGLSWYLKDFDTVQYANDQGISIQMAARDLRYAWFHQLAETYHFDCIATAHHLDDQTETFFINLIRGTGIAGLHGILPRTGRIVRPLLFATREDIDQYIRANHLPFREDASNNSLKYLRNQIRHTILPAFETIEPGFSHKLADTIAHVRSGEEIIHAAVERARKTIVTRDGETVYMDKMALMALHPVAYYLYEFLKPYRFNATQVQDIIHSLSDPAGKNFSANNFTLTVGRKSLVIQEITNIISQQKALWIEEFEQIDTPVCLKMQREKIQPGSFFIPKEANVACLDSALVKFPLLLRKWEQGDYFFPLGMDKRKLLSDFFIDEKFEMEQKAATWLLLSQDDIVWVVGHRIDHRYRVTDSTTEIIRFTQC